MIIDTCSTIRGHNVRFSEAKNKKNYLQREGLTSQTSRLTLVPKDSSKANNMKRNMDMTRNDIKTLLLEFAYSMKIIHICLAQVLPILQKIYQLLICHNSLILPVNTSWEHYLNKNVKFPLTMQACSQYHLGKVKLAPPIADILILLVCPHAHHILV
jgi:hypothetical protein